MSEKIIDKNINFLKGGGEMGVLIRAKDWSKTPVGPIENWPQSLRTTLGILLNSKFPMFLWWGPDLICFYNDAYRPSLGQNGKHPSILGIKAADAWPEIWDIIKPLIDQVLTTGEATWHENALVPIYRNGKIEDVYWTFSYSPVYNENNKIAGVLVTVNETTENVFTYKKLEEKNNELLFAIDAAEFATFDFNPLTKKFSSNDRLKEWFGFQSAAQIELAEAINIIAEDDRARILKVIEAALDFSTGENFEVEFTIVHPDTKQERIIRAKGKSWFNEDKIAYRLSGTMQDITHHILARRKTELSEKRISALINNVPFPIGVYEGAEMRIALANQAIIDAWGKGNDVIGKLFSEVLPELENQQIFDQLRNVYETGIAFHAYNQHVDVMMDGEMHSFYYNYSFTPLLDSEGKVYAVMNTAANLTDIYVSKQKVEESEKRFRNIADTAPVMIWMSGTDKVCNYFNTSWLKFRGRTLEQESDGGWLQGVHPEDLKRCTNIYINAFDKREEFFMEYRLQRADDKYRWISVKGTPRFTTDGTFEGYIGAGMDIHERTVYQDILQRSELKLNIVIEASELGIWELDLKTSEVSYSDKYLEILGHEKGAKLTHEQLKKYIHPDDMDKRDKAFRNAFETGMLYSQTRMIWDDGSIHWIEGKGKVFYDEENKPAKMVGTVLDISERKQSENELSNTANRLRLALEAGKLGSYEVNVETGEIVCTAQTRQNFGLKEKDKFTYNVLMEMIVPEDRESMKQAVQLSFDNNSVYNAEYRIVKSDDKSIHWINALGLPVYNKEGEPIEMAGVTIDITERKLFEMGLENQVMERTRELEQKNVELEKMNRELQSFAYISSHDLQEPLRKIQTFASRITDKEYNNLSESGKDYFKRMQESARRMQVLIDELLAYSRTNTEDRHYEKAKLKNIIEEVKDDLEMELAQKNAVIETGELVQVKVIPFQFRQLIQNLISNSLKFAKENEAPHIKITSEIADSADLNYPKLLKNTSYCHISISDNGIGFEQEYNEKIFEVFQRLHGKQEYKGTGIGLAIVKRIIDNHNGFITAKGESGKGATFDIYIPAKQK